jgi:transglutaminase-like putative cysteine protease
VKRSRLFIVIIYVLSLFVGFIPQALSAASDFTYNTEVTYRAEDATNVSVTEAYSITNNTARKYLTEIKLFTPTEKVENLKVAYDDGTVIPSTATKVNSSRGDIKYDVQEISIKFPRTIVGTGRVWKFRVSYTTSGLLDTKGNAHTVYIPSIDAGDPGDTYTVTVDVPQDFGTPHFAGAPSSSAGLSGSRQLFRFVKSDLIEHSLALAFGDSTIYNANFNFPLRNDAPWPQTLTVTLPPDLNNQKTFINSLSPKPSSVRLDEDGNVLAEFRLNGHEKITVTTDVSTEVKYLEYDLGVSGKKADIPADLVKKYTKSTRYWKTDGAVAAEAKKIVDDNVPVINNVKAVYQYVITKLSYNNDKIKFNIRQGSDKALGNPDNAVCLEYADLMIAMLRSQGIPARMPIGYAYSGSLKDSTAVADSLHAWVEAYVPGIGWMTFDPTWGEKFDGFGKSDLDHFAFAIWGQDDAVPTAISSGAFDANYQYENATVNYKTKITPLSAVGELKVWRWVILPFLSLDHVAVTAMPQVASDNNRVTINNEALELGSLAPTQKAKLNRLVLGTNWNKASEAKFQQGDTIVLATTQVEPNYVLPTLFVVLVVVLVVARAVHRRRRREAAVEVNEEIEHS